MSDYRRGDVESPLGTLRLTVGALAEIAEVTGAESPRALAERVRVMGPDTARVLLGAMLRGGGGTGDLSAVTDAEVAALMPQLAACISTSLVPA